MFNSVRPAAKYEPALSIVEKRFKLTLTSLYQLQNNWIDLQFFPDSIISSIVINLIIIRPTDKVNECINIFPSLMYVQRFETKYCIVVYIATLIPNTKSKQFGKFTILLIIFV